MTQNDELYGVIDDSALFHYSKGYDPVKAREYYLRTRKLKGRKKGRNDQTTMSRKEFKKHATGNEGKYDRYRNKGKANRADTKSRRAELLAERERLEKRLDRLREVLDTLMKDAVKRAKKRSGGDPNKSDSDTEKDKAPETKADKADRNKAEKDAKPLTAKQKADKAKKAKEEYEKEHPNSLSTDVDILREQVKDIQAKIERAVADARERRKRADSRTDKPKVRSNPKNNANDGPRGR